MTSSARASRVWGTVRPSTLGSFEIDDQLEPGRLHDREIARSRALEDPADVDARLTPHLHASRTVADQTSSDDLIALAEHSRNSMVGGNSYQVLGLLAKKCIVVKEQSPDRFFATDRESGLDLIFADGRKRQEPQAEALRRRLDALADSRGIGVLRVD